MGKMTRDGTGTQFAALPFRIADGGLQILLITSRETRRWIIPKGWPIRGLRPREVAAREALEEAGLVGRIVGQRSIDSYHYSKHFPDNHELICRVKVFLLLVDRQLDVWREKGQREQRWVDPTKGAQMVDEGGLAEIMRSAFPALQQLKPKAGKHRGLPR